MNHITKRFGKVTALSDGNLRVRPGTVHALMGENGAGKSTLMKCLFGIYHKDDGEIILDGKSVNFSDSADALAHNVAMVHQELNQVLFQNVMENMWLGRYPLKRGLIDEKTMYEKTKKIFNDFDINVDPKVKVGSLQVAQKQMIEIAKAISYDSKILVLDEPTSSLTEKEVEHLFRILKRILARGIGIIFITHKMDEVMRIADDVTVMRDGQWIATRKTSEITEKEIEQIRLDIEEQNSEKLKQMLADMHPADIAELCDELDIEETRYIFRQLDNETVADILMEMDEDTRKELLDQLPSEIIAKRFVDNMETDDAADLMRELDKERKEEVLQHMEDIEQASDIVDLLKYEEGTAGALMKTEMVTINQNWSMPESLKQMRIQAEDADEIHYVYVVDDEERLVGVFQLKTMITSPNVSKIKHVMKRDPISVKVDTPIEDVAQAIEKYDLVALPVIDSIGRLVGQITVDDVMDEAREHSERDYQLASGLSQDIDTDDNIFRQTTARLPWLLLGMFGGIANSVILGKFDVLLRRFPEMVIYIPLIGGTGGNVGTQSSAIIVQGLANNSLDGNNILKQISKESIVALINATLISLLMYIYNFLRYGPTSTVSYSVSLSLFCVVLFASLFGTLVPMTLERLKIDPAIATGPFIAIANDIIGVLIYLAITMLLS